MALWVDDSIVSGTCSSPENISFQQILHPTQIVSFHLDEILSPLVFGEELQLLGVNGAPPLLSDQVDRVLVLHS